jgi:hypothetical protein
MGENEGESQQGYDLAKEEPSTTGDVDMTDSTESKAEAEPVSETQPEEEEDGEHKKTSEKVKEKVEHAKDKVEGLVEKVKDLAVGDGTSLSTSPDSSLLHGLTRHLLPPNYPPNPILLPDPR